MVCLLPLILCYRGLEVCYELGVCLYLGIPDMGKKSSISKHMCALIYVLCCPKFSMFFLKKGLSQGMIKALANRKSRKLDY